MTVEGFVLGFALIVVGLIAASAYKDEVGRIGIAIACALLGVFGFGYFVGVESASDRYWEKLHNLSSGSLDATQAELAQMVVKMTALNGRPSVSGWFYLVAFTLMMCGGIASHALVTRYMEKRVLNARKAPEAKPAEQPEQ